MKTAGTTRPVARIETDAAGRGRVEIGCETILIREASAADGRRAAFALVAEHARVLGEPVAVRWLTPDGSVDVVITGGSASSVVSELCDLEGERPRLWSSRDVQDANKFSVLCIARRDWRFAVVLAMVCSAAFAALLAG